MNIVNVKQQGLVLAPLDCFSCSKQISHLHLCRHDAVRGTGQGTLCELCRPDCAGNGLKGASKGEGWRIFKAVSISNVGSECKAQMFSAFSSLCLHGCGTGNRLRKGRWEHSSEVAPSARRYGGIWSSEILLCQLEKYWASLELGRSWQPDWVLSQRLPHTAQGADSQLLHSITDHGHLHTQLLAYPQSSGMQASTASPTTFWPHSSLRLSVLGLPWLASRTQTALRWVAQWTPHHFQTLENAPSQSQPAAERCNMAIKGTKTI